MRSVGSAERQGDPEWAERWAGARTARKFDNDLDLWYKVKATFEKVKRPIPGREGRV